MGQALLVNAFEKPWPKRRMHLERGIQYCASDLINIHGVLCVLGGLGLLGSTRLCSQLLRHRCLRCREARRQHAVR